MWCSSCSAAKLSLAVYKIPECVLSITDVDASGPVDALLALASPPPRAAMEPASALALTAIPHHVATQRTGTQSFPLIVTQH